MALHQWPHLLLANSKRLCEDRVSPRMRHQKKTIKLGRTADHRRALLANQVCAFATQNLYIAGAKMLFNSPHREAVQAPQSRNYSLPIFSGMNRRGYLSMNYTGAANARAAVGFCPVSRRRAAALPHAGEIGVAIGHARHLRERHGRAQDQAGDERRRAHYLTSTAG